MDFRGFFEANNVELWRKIDWFWESWNQPMKFYLWACHHAKFFEFCMKIFKLCKFCESWLTGSFVKNFVIEQNFEVGENLVILAFIFILRSKRHQESIHI